jgi:hypothetical protein
LWWWSPEPLKALARVCRCTGDCSWCAFSE